MVFLFQGYARSSSGPGVGPEKHCSLWRRPEERDHHGGVGGRHVLLHAPRVPAVQRSLSQGKSAKFGFFKKGYVALL